MLLGLGVIALVWLTLPCAAHAQSIDPIEGVVVSAIHVSGLRNLTSAEVEGHLATRVGQPFHRANLNIDRRRLDELRLFSSVAIEARLEQQAVVVDVLVAETLRVLPVVVLRVTDENGLSIGPGMRGINLLGHGAQTAATVRFGGETAVTFSVDSTTITPGRLAWHAGFSDTSRKNALYGFDEHATSVDARIGHNWSHTLKSGFVGEFLTLDTGGSAASLSPDGRDVIPTAGLFATLDSLNSSTDPRRGTWAELQIDRLFADASSWTFTIDARRYQPFTSRQGLGLFSLVSLQTGTVGETLPEYMQFALGGANSIRGWELGSRIGRNQFIGTVEYAYVAQPVTAFTVAGLHLYTGVQVAGFADLGLTWNDANDWNVASAIDGYGVGVRLLVPYVDVIRIDVAWGDPNRGAFGYFGVSLKAARQRQRVR